MVFKFNIATIVPYKTTIHVLIASFCDTKWDLNDFGQLRIYWQDIYFLQQVEVHLMLYMYVGEALHDNIC